MNPLHLSLVELCEALRAKRISAVELMETTLARLDETRDRLNAVVTVRAREALLGDARAADDRIARGEARSLEGIPLGVKDLEDVAGMVTTHGSIPFRDRVAEHDSIQIERLRSAGAIVVGKTNTPEFGHTAVTKNLIFGVTRSPWDAERTPGGSSGGSAAALAGEVLPLVTASDGGGSIRIPASFTGAFGLKPSYGRVPIGPRSLWSHGATVVLGPLTKTVNDAALFLDQVAGHDPRDPSSLPHPGSSYVRCLDEDLPRGTRFGFTIDLGRAVVQSDVAAVVEGAAGVFEGLGHSLVDMRLDEHSAPPDVAAYWGLLGSWEASAELSEMLAERPGDFARSFLEGMRFAGGLTPAWWGDMARARQALAAWCARAFQQHDLLLMPTVPYDPPPARGPFPAETEGRKQTTASVASFTIPFNMSWHPAASVRAGLSRAGLPVGLQIVGPIHREDLVLRAARAFERVRPWSSGDAAWPLRG